MIAFMKENMTFKDKNKVPKLTNVWSNHKMMLHKIHVTEELVRV